MLGIKKLKRYVSFLNRNSQTIYDSTDHSSVIRDVCLMKLPRVPLCNILKTKIHMYFFFNNMSNLEARWIISFFEPI